MRIRLTAVSVILTVTVTALFGMLLGAAFGYGAGRLAPEFFAHLISWTELEPLGVSVLLGSIGGVVCGGSLGVFAVAIQALATWIERRPSP